MTPGPGQDPKPRAEDPRPGTKAHALLGPAPARLSGIPPHLGSGLGKGSGVCHAFLAKHIAFNSHLDKKKKGELRSPFFIKILSKNKCFANYGRFGCVGAHSLQKNVFFVLFYLFEVLFVFDWFYSFLLSVFWLLA